MRKLQRDQLAVSHWEDLHLRLAAENKSQYERDIVRFSKWAQHLRSILLGSVYSCTHYEATQRNTWSMHWDWPICVLYRLQESVRQCLQRRALESHEILRIFRKDRETFIIPVPRNIMRSTCRWLSYRLVPYGNGGIQGCVLSPIIYNILLEMVMVRAAEGVEYLGAVISGYTISNLRFADDIATLVESSNDLQTMASNIHREGSRMGFHI